MKQKLILILIILLVVFVASGCGNETTVTTTASMTVSSATTSSGTNMTMSGTTTSGTDTTSVTGTTSRDLTWDHESITYLASDIRTFGSATPAGTVNYDSLDDEAIIWNIDASLDNYGGIQTPTLALDFSKAVIFQMEVVSAYTEYIVKLAVEGESEYYYVLSDEPKLGLVSVNVVDSMLSEKYQTRNTQPDPGYATGWKYDSEVKNCSFHILAKGPDGEKQTAELVIKSISIYNDQVPVNSVSIESDAIVAGKISRLKSSASTQLDARMDPATGVDDTIIWSTDDESIAQVDQEGKLEFVGVGKTYVTATSMIDQSKSDRILVDVLSGYENPDLLKTRLEELTYDGGTTDSQAFLDLYNTTWAEDMSQAVTMADYSYLDLRPSADGYIVEDYFNPQIPAQTAMAESDRNGDVANLSLALSDLSQATVYYLLDGALYKETAVSSLELGYADFSQILGKMPTYTEKFIIVTASGAVRKLEIKHLAARLLGEFTGNDFADTDQWVIPDRTKQTIDPVVNQLSPASVTINGGSLYLHQNKYPEAKYCFGGIVSEVFSGDVEKEVEILLDVTGLNQMNDYVKTMWEVKIIYFHDASGTMAVSSNPLKLASGNETGLQTIVFNPSYQYFRLYLVANGSDIGQQFADAEIQVASLKIQVLE